jgi:hypothetical protein
MRSNSQLPAFLRVDFVTGRGMRTGNALLWGSMSRFCAVPFRLVAALLLSVGSIFAMTVVPVDFNKLLDRAEQIYKAQIVSVTSDWSGEGVNRHPATFVRLRVLESYRGGAQDEQTLEFSGGTIGQRTLRIPGMPEFQAGDTEILFVRGNRTEFCPLVGIYHGRLRVVKNGANGAEEILLHDGTPLVDVAQIGNSADQFKAAATAAKSTGARALTPAELGATIRAGLRQRGITPDKP